jgi:hypothetical protein
MLLFEENKCPRCRHKKLRTPVGDDPVYLISKDAIIAASVEDILAQNGIPCLKRGTLGAGITGFVGYTLETFRFYVPYNALSEARELLSNFLEENNNEEQEWEDEQDT